MNVNDQPVKTLDEIRDMATEMAGLARALDLLMVIVEDSKDFQSATCTIVSLVKDRSDAINRALDEYTTRNPERKPA